MKFESIAYMYENIHDSDIWGRIKCIRNFLERIVLKIPALFKNIFYHVYTVRSEKYFCKKKGSYRIRLLFPVRVMPFQIVEGTEPSRLLSSSDLQNKNIK